MANSFFDNAFDDAQWKPDQNFIEQILANPAIQPSAGFPQDPMNANAAMPQAAAPAAPSPQPQQAAPINVGGYQMPRVGPATAFDLPAGTLDPNTGEHVTAPAPAAPAAAPQSIGGGIAQHVGAALNSIGAPNSLFHNMVTNPINALITGQTPADTARAQQASLQQAQIKQLSAALIAGRPDISQQEAIQLATIHAIDPAAGKALIEKRLGPPQAAPQYIWDHGKAVKTYDTEAKDNFDTKQTGEDAQGNKIFQKLNRGDGTLTPITNPGSPPNAGLGDMSLTGPAYLATLPKSEQIAVQAMLDGRSAPPSSFVRAKPLWQARMAAANNVDSSFDEASWPARVKGMVSFRSGADAGTVRSANQVLGHISDLTDKADELHNGNYPSANWIGNKFNEATGSDAPGNWVIQGHAVADELSSFMKGAGHSSDTEIQQWKESLSPNMSPQQQRGAIKTLMGIYDHALVALEDKRTGAIGPVAAEKMGPLVTAAGQAAMDKVRKWSAVPASGAPASGGTAPTGVKWSVVQ